MASPPPLPPEQASAPPLEPFTASSSLLQASTTFSFFLPLTAPLTPDLLTLLREQILQHFSTLSAWISISILHAGDFRIYSCYRSLLDYHGPLPPFQALLAQLTHNLGGFHLSLLCMALPQLP